MPTIEEVHTKIKQAMLDHHRWDKNVSASLNHDRGMKLDDSLIYYDHHIYIPPKIMCCEGKLSQHLMTISRQDTLALRRPKNSYYENTGAQDEEGHRKITSVPVKRANKPSQALKQKLRHFILMPSPPDLGHTSPLTWSLVYLGATVKMLS